MPTGFSLAIMLAAALVTAAPAGAADLNFTFEDPPYTNGSADGQDGWYQEETESVPVVSSSAPLAGSQSLYFVADSGAPALQRIWHGLAGQTFTEITTFEFLLQTSEGQLGVLMQDSTGQGYFRLTVDSEFESWAFGYGEDAAATTNFSGGADAFKPNKLYRVNVTFDFGNSNLQSTVTDLTDSVAVLDTGLLALNSSTTTNTAAAGGLYQGIRFTGGHNWTSHSEGWIDDVRFNYVQPDLNFTFEDPPYTAGSIDGQDGWYQEETESVPAVSSSAPLAGSQSLLFVADGGAPPLQRIWRGLADQPFTDVTRLEFLLQTSEGLLGILLQDATGKAYYRLRVDSELENWTFGSGEDAVESTTVFAGGADAFKPNKLYRVKATFDFGNLEQRTTVRNLTDSVAVLDTGILELNSSTTPLTAAADGLYQGIRLTGTHNFTSHSEGRIDNILFNAPVEAPVTGWLFVAQ